MGTPVDPYEGIVSGPLGLPLHHLSFAVDDLRSAVEAWTTRMGAGPFYVLEHMVFETAEYEGAPATFDHSAAFGQWGQIAVELQQLHKLEPAGFEQKLDTPLNHVAYVSPQAAADSRRLVEAGMPMYFEAVMSPVHVRFHSAPAGSIEILQDCDFLADFYQQIRDEARGWDGTDPFRTLASV